MPKNNDLNYSTDTSFDFELSIIINMVLLSQGCSSGCQVVCLWDLQEEFCGQMQLGQSYVAAQEPAASALQVQALLQGNFAQFFISIEIVRE